MKYSIKGRFWFDKNDKSLFGKGKIELLRNIHVAGSILQASKNMKMSYRAAWEDIKAMNEAAGEPLVESGPGKKSGSSLTLKALEMLDYFKMAEKEFNMILSQVSQEHNYFSAQIMDITEGIDCIHYTLSAQSHVLYSIMPSGYKEYQAGDEVHANVFSQRLIPVMPVALDNIGVDNIIKGIVTSIQPDTVILQTEIGDFTINCNLPVKINDPLAAICTAHDIWFY